MITKSEAQQIVQKHTGWKPVDYGAAWKTSEAKAFHGRLYDARFEAMETPCGWLFHPPELQIGGSRLVPRQPLDWGGSRRRVDTGRAHKVSSHRGNAPTVHRGLSRAALIRSAIMWVGAISTLKYPANPHNHRLDHRFRFTRPCVRWHEYCTRYEQVVSWSTKLC